MSSPVPVVLLTADHSRHRWLAAALATAPQLELRGVISEAKSIAPQQANAGQPESLRRHFEARAEAEGRYFGDAPEWNDLGGDLLVLQSGEANNPDTVRWIAERSATHLLLFGSSIIDAPLLDLFPERTINTHLGLSPYFRGTATNFWALEQGLPECVGATVHLATASVDAGPILRQFRPPLEPGDDLHDAGCKVVIAAAAGLPDTVAAYADHRLRPTPQHPGGLLFRSADFDEAALARTHRRLANGLIQSYLADKAERDAAYPIVE